MPSKYTDILRFVEIFESLPPEELDPIANLLKEVRYRDGQVVFHRGDVGDALYIVAGGRVKIYFEEGGAEKVLAFFAEGEVFGEMALLTGEPRIASAMAMGDTRLLVLHKKDFDKQLSSNLNIIRKWMRIIAVRQLRANERLAGGGDGAADTAAANGRVYAVFSPRGGSGKTTVAVNLAVSFAQIYPERTVLLDLSLTFGHCALMLDLPPKAPLASVSLEGLSKLDREGLNYYLAPHTSSLRVWSGSSKPEEGEAVTADHVRGALELLRRLAAVTIVDTSGTFSEATIGALEGADKVLLVCTPEITTLRDVLECQRIFTELIRIPIDKLYYVMNRPWASTPLTLDQFEKSIEQKVRQEIPFGGDLPSKVAARGEALVQAAPGSATTRAIESLAQALEAEANPVSAPRQQRRGLFARR